MSGFPFPVELLGLGTSTRAPKGQSLDDYMFNNRVQSARESDAAHQLAEQQQHDRAIESHAADELEREKARDAVNGQLAQSKMAHKMSEGDNKLFHQYMIRAIQAEAVGDTTAAQQYRMAAQSLSDSSPAAGEPEPTLGGHQATSGPAFEPEAAPTAPSPFVDQGGLEFSSAGPSGAFRTSKPGSTPTEAPGRPALDMPDQDMTSEAPQGAYGTGFDTSKVGATDPSSVDSSAIMSSMLGVPVQGKKPKTEKAGKHPKQTIDLVDPSDPANDLYSSPQDYALPKENVPAYASAPPKEETMRTPDGRTMRIASSGRPGVDTVVKMWADRVANAGNDAERKAAEAGQAAASVSQNPELAQKHSEQAYKDTLAQYKKQGAGGGGGGGGIDEKRLDKDYAFNMGVAKDAEAQIKTAKKGMDDADRVVTLLTDGQRTGFKDRDALEAHLRAVVQTKVNMQQLKMTMEGAGAWEQLNNHIGTFLHGGKLSDEFVRQMLDAAKTARKAAKEAYDREVRAAEGMAESRYQDRPAENRKRNIDAVHVKITGEKNVTGATNTDDDQELEAWRKSRGK